MRTEISSPVAENVLIGTHSLLGEWLLPTQSVGIVVYSHSSGSRRQISRNRHVARVLYSYGLGTLLFDLLSPDEAMQRDNSWNVSLLTERVQDALVWLWTARAETRSLPIGLFADGPGTAAALIASVRMPRRVSAIVSCSGRPDMADGYLADVRTPTLLIVGGKDPYILNVNRVCSQSMTCVAELAVIPRATQLFEELGTLDAVTVLAGNWFSTHFTPSGDVPVDEILLRR